MTKTISKESSFPTSRHIYFQYTKIANSHKRWDTNIKQLAMLTKKQTFFHAIFSHFFSKPTKFKKTLSKIKFKRDFFNRLVIDDTKMKQYLEKLFGKKHMVATTSDLSNSFLIYFRTALLNAKLPTF